MAMPRPMKASPGRKLYPSKVVVREAPRRLGKQLNVAAERLETGAPAARAPGFGLKEEVLRYVITGGDAVHRVSAEVLDRERPVVEPQLDVRAPDARHGDLAPRDLRLDDARWRALIRRGLALAGLRALRLGGALLGAALGALVKPVAHRGAAGERGQQRRQKKNANPSFHSSASSFRLRLVRIQCALNSPRTKKRRAR